MFKNNNTSRKLKEMLYLETIFFLCVFLIKDGEII